MKFTEEQLKELEANENIDCVLNNQLWYTQKFKNKAIEEYAQGKTARQIFEEAGFNLQILSKRPDYASKMLSKWRLAKKNNIHYPKKKIKEKQSAYQKLLARNEYLEAENEFLKKLQALIQQHK